MRSSTQIPLSSKPCTARLAPLGHCPLGRRKDSSALGHRSGDLMPSLISQGKTAQCAVLRKPCSPSFAQKPRFCSSAKDVYYFCGGLVEMTRASCCHIERSRNISRVSADNNAIPLQQPQNILWAVPLNNGALVHILLCTMRVNIFALIF